MIPSSDVFEGRHIGPDADSTASMLQYMGLPSVDDLIEKTVPASIRRQDVMDLPEALTESELIQDLKDLASKNEVRTSFVGLGYYGTKVPMVILRNILENPGWYTQYTPYQAEIAQGRLEALINYQTMITDLTGMEVANASLLDEGTAAAEAMSMLFNERPKNQGHRMVVSHKAFPQTIDVLQTRSVPMGIEVEVADLMQIELTEEIFAVMIQYPDLEGGIQNYRSFVDSCHEKGILVAVAADILGLCLLDAPGNWGADVVFGSAQRFGVPMGYGGPHAAFFASRQAFVRQMPGRLIGVSKDSHGDIAYRMTLQTREQHIKRSKATSNICTAQVLLAIMSGMYAVYHGATGLKNIALRAHGAAKLLAAKGQELGYDLVNQDFFDTITFTCSDSVKEALLKQCDEKGINIRSTHQGFSLSLDESHELAQLQLLIDVMAAASGNSSTTITKQDWAEHCTVEWHADMQRSTEYLTHQVFNTHHSEHEMLRYIKRLENKDLSLAHSMIALGSCTMKLNATAEMIPVTWPEFGNIHPFAPQTQAAGYLEMIHRLEEYLMTITGFAGISFQPNSGAQGEYAGLMVIRAYHHDRGDTHRNIALIPTSAHGTNPASAVMAGMKVVEVKCNELGNIDVEDLKAKAELHSANLSCLMVTYPSTHGVFEEAIKEICDTIHQHGGQVYMDGANMNAQVGLTSPALIGADVCHLNLHKTFCIPHGGGGPGMGPIGVGAHLKPYLPGHVLVDEVGGAMGISAVSSAPFGSASILIISYAYIRMMGAEGLTNATKYAILNANYMRARLEKHFPILYAGTHGTCAHEMIVDMRKFKASAGVEVEDIAKRLMDYGFHAPTVSFPVAGTLMIEPTESEPREELDRFCDALIAIGEEIAEIERGEADAKDNVLKNAPHTAGLALADEWEKPYSRQKAVFPLNWVKERKFWPSVGRVDNSYGDRNLFCVCPPMEAYAEELS